jgi:phage-related protein
MRALKCSLLCVPLPRLQSQILRLLAAHRDPESYVAGSTPLTRGRQSEERAIGKGNAGGCQRRFLFDSLYKNLYIQITMNDDEIELKELEWIASSRKDLQALPRSVQRTFGYALYAAQLGEKPPEGKPLKGFGGAGMLELIEDYRGNTFRAVYTVRFPTKVYVRHVFQKKAKHGIATPKQELDLIRDRLKQAESLYTGRHKEVLI